MSAEYSQDGKSPKVGTGDSPSASARRKRWAPSLRQAPALPSGLYLSAHQGFTCLRSRVGHGIPDRMSTRFKRLNSELSCYPCGGD
jgi:hypothetical protein